MTKMLRFAWVAILAAALVGCDGGVKKPAKPKAKSKTAPAAPAMPAGAGMPQPDSGGSPDAEEEAPPPASKPPKRTSPAPQEEPETPEVAATGGLPFSAPEFFAAVHLRPAKILSAPLAKKVFHMLFPPPAGDGALRAVLSPQQQETASGIVRALEPWKGIEDFWIFVYEVEPGPAPKLSMAFAVRSKAPLAARDFAMRFGGAPPPKETIVDGRKFLVVPNSEEVEIDPFKFPPVPEPRFIPDDPAMRRAPKPIALFQLDARTILNGELKLLQRTLSASPKPSPLSMLAEKQRLDAPFTILWTPGPFKPLLAEARSRLEAGALAAPYSKLPEFLPRLESAVLELSLEGPELLGLEVALDDVAAGARLKEALEEVWAEGKMIVSMGAQQAKGTLGAKTEEAVKVIRDSAFVESAANGARLSFGLPPSLEAVIDEAVAAAIPKAGVANDLAQRTNNLREIALSFQLFDASFKKLPADRLSKDGKRILSWRALILPQIDQSALFDKLDGRAAWDSEVNKPLLDQMPKLFEVPGARPGHTSIFVFRGKGTAFADPSESFSYFQVADGKSDTILLVVAKPEYAVPWTQPFDLDFDPKNVGELLKALPEKNVLVAMFDGAAFVWKERPKADVLKALITVGGGEKVAPPK